MGVESGSQKILDAMDKGTRIAQAPGAVERLRKAGIRACFFIQLGYPGEGMEDILATIRLVRETLPDDIGVSVSYPLPGTKLYNMVKAELGDKRHWDESNDMAMMFRGPFRTPFYRTLRDLLHRDLVLRQRLRSGVESAETIEAQLELLERDWSAWQSSEADYRQEEPTQIFKYYDAAAAPDLSERWN
jgi:anaerobic magnesium-protoporphyrin IX monomethyl ester cyclase